MKATIIAMIAGAVALGASTAAYVVYQPAQTCLEYTHSLFPDMENMEWRMRATVTGATLRTNGRVKGQEVLAFCKETHGEVESFKYAVNPKVTTGGVIANWIVPDSMAERSGHNE